MQPIYVSIQQEATGKNIKSMLRQKGYSVRDVQQVMGFENPQAVYKWLSGQSLPNLDNLLILSRLLETDIESILVLRENVLVKTDNKAIIHKEQKKSFASEALFSFPQYKMCFAQKMCMKRTLFTKSKVFKKRIIRTMVY